MLYVSIRDSRIKNLDQFVALEELEGTFGHLAESLTANVPYIYRRFIRFHFAHSNAPIAMT